MTLRDDCQKIINIPTKRKRGNMTTNIREAEPIRPAGIKDFSNHQNDLNCLIAVAAAIRYESIYILCLSSPSLSAK